MSASGETTGAGNRTYALSSGKQPVSRPSGRLRSLDGLRGLAALVVLIHHSLLIIPELALPYYDKTAELPRWAWIMTYTPLHALWEGQSAVYVFFVLSGVVLTLPLLKSSSFSWVAYYPQRLLRLYIPTWGAVVLGVAWIELVPRIAQRSGPWIQNRPKSASMHDIVLQAFVLGDNPRLVSPLWSLKWEILFSLLLPLFAVIALGLARFPLLVSSVAFGLITYGVLHVNVYLLYLPMFLIGMAIATALDRLQKLRVNTFIGIVLTSLAILCLLAPWLLYPFEIVSPLTTIVVVFGATLAVICAIVVPGVRNFLSTRFLQWLGLISFSLYLVHEPLVISIGFLIDESNAPLAVVAGMVLAFPLASLFRRLVEAPSHRLARLVGDQVRRVTTRRHRPIGRHARVS